MDFGKLQADVEAAAEVSGLNQENAQLLRRFYGLNGGELVHWILYTAQDNMSVEELLLVEGSSESQAEQVLEAARSGSHPDKKL